MTLHWWMHWFWITLLTLSVCVCSPIPPTSESPSIDISTSSTANIESKHDLDIVSSTIVSSTYPTIIPVSKTSRGGKAIGKSSPNLSTALPNLKVSVDFPLAESSDTGDEGTALQKETSLHLDYSKKPSPQPEDRLSSTILAPAVTAEITNFTEPTDEVVTEAITSNVTNPNNATSDVLVPNNATILSDVPNVTVDPIISSTANITAVTAAVENKIVKYVEPVKNSTNENAVEVSTVRALLLETRRAADNEVRKNAIPTDDEGLDAGAVAGICFGSLVIIGLAGAISLVLYRRRYLNKPQTLNDKCSNPDSSGYIDDSTMRENSEEMYSLDNDSFLNSLEAMTIQNYWTDSVKHTKL